MSWSVNTVSPGGIRFDQIEANIGLSSSMLTTRLKSLVDKGILVKRRYQERPNRYEYLLTDFGRSLRPILVAMAAWRNAQLAPEGRAMILVDSETGREVEAIVVDTETGLPVSDPRFRFTAGPTASPEMRRRYDRRAPEPDESDGAGEPASVDRVTGLRGSPSASEGRRR